MSFLASALLRPRTDLRKRLDAWAKTAMERLSATGAETYAASEAPEAGSPSDAPVHRVVFIARGTKSQHARERLVLAYDAEHIEVGVEAQPSAVSSLRALMADAERSIELLAALDALPEQFEIGALGAHGAHEAVGGRTSWQRASSGEIRQILDRVEASQSPFWLGWSVPRELALAHAESLDEQMQDALVALGPVFALLDGMSAALPRRGQDQTAGARDGAPDHQGSRPGQRASRAELRDRRGSDDDGATRRRSRGQDRRRERDHEVVESSDPEPEVESDASPRLARGANGAKRAGLGAASRRRSLQPRIDPHAPVDRGTLVRVLDGPFSGKVGVVQELDGKGGARVLLGLLAVRIGVKDLAACAKGRERPLLSSSHRKPLPVRS